MSVQSSRFTARRLLAICALAGFVSTADAFVPAFSAHHTCTRSNTKKSALHAENKLTLIQDQDVIATPIAFRLEDDSSNKKKENEESVIMCYVDCIAKINDVDYSVG